MVKFRTWDKENQRYLYDGLTKYLDDEKYENELFTDLRDKDGTRIYVGDILKDSAGWHYVVKYTIKYGFRLCAGIEDKGAELSEVEQSDYRLIACKIVGNIHENPELLGVKDD